MTAEKTLYLEDLPVGKVLTSASRTITAQDIADYCELSGDHNPLHKDDEWVRENTPFEQRIAHGLLVLGASSGTPCPELDALLIVAYLSESRNFKAPTYPGESIVTTWEVVENRPSKSKPDQGLVRLAVVSMPRRRMMACTSTESMCRGWPLSISGEARSTSTTRGRC
jgi:acyl dehydratase